MNLKIRTSRGLRTDRVFKFILIVCGLLPILCRAGVDNNSAVGLSQCEQEKFQCALNAQLKKNSCESLVGSASVIGNPETLATGGMSQSNHMTCLIDADRMASSCNEKECSEPLSRSIEDGSSGIPGLPDAPSPTCASNPTQLAMGMAPCTSDPVAQPAGAAPAAPKAVTPKSVTAAKPAGAPAAAPAGDGKTTPESGGTAEDTKQAAEEGGGSGEGQQKTTDPMANNPTDPQSPGLDIDQANQAADGARQCCNNPASCASATGSAGQSSLGQLASLGQSMGSGGGGGGLQAACQQMQGLGGAGSTANSAFASVCYAKKSSCEGLTSSLISKYQSVGDSSTVSQLQSIKSSCTGLQAKIDAMSSQASGGAQSGGMGALCSQLAAAQTASQEGLANNSRVTCEENPSDPTCVNCAKDPTNAICPKSTGDSAASGYKNSRDENENSFNTPEMPTTGDGMLAGGGEAYQSASATLIPNNSGGGIPGGSGSAAGGGGGSNKGGGGSAGYNTDIMQGTMSGGYSAQAGNMNMGTEGGGGFGGYGRGNSDSSGYAGLDLKKYLPGGASDPRRQIAGLSSGSGDIGSKYGDIFKRISDRVQTLCRFDRLLECNNKK